MKAIESLNGHLLVASTEIDDDVFSESVCLVVQNSHEGTVGLLLNRPLTPQPSNLLALLESDTRLSARPHAPAKIHYGGPLSGPVIALHGTPPLAEAETVAGVYVAAQIEHLQQLVQTAQNHDYRLLVGHAGWEVGQLEAEVEQGKWHLLPARSEAVFVDDEIMWPALIREACGHSLARWTRSGQPPPFVEMN